VFCILLVFSLLGGLFFTYTSQENKISSLDHTVQVLEKSYAKKGGTSGDDLQLEFYRELDTKANATISSILIVMGLLVSIFAIVSILIAFKAPNDIFQKINELDNQFGEIQKHIDEVHYQAGLAKAINKSDPYERIQELGRLIRSYPSKAAAYLERGWLYNDQANYQRATDDIEAAFENGLDSYQYYLAMGIVSSQSGESEKAIQYYTLAIEEDKHASAAYTDRGIEYGAIKEYEKALSDFKTALLFETDCYEVYVNRAEIYANMAIQEGISNENALSFINKSFNDYKHSLEINPTSEPAKRQFQDLAKKLGIAKDGESSDVDPRYAAILGYNISQTFKQMAEKARSENNQKLAVELFVRSLLFYFSLKEPNEQYKKNQKNIEETISDLVLKHRDIVYHLEKDLDGILASVLYSKAYSTYASGHHEDAEYLFNLVRSLAPGYAEINLAYMKRRGEAPNTKRTVEELLDSSDDKTSAVWCINYAIYCLDTNFDYLNPKKAAIVMLQASSELEESYDWWNNTARVGKREHNIGVLLLKSIGEAKNDSVSIADRALMAKADGFCVEEYFDYLNNTRPKQTDVSLLSDKADSTCSASISMADTEPTHETIDASNAEASGKQEHPFEQENQAKGTHEVQSLFPAKHPADDA